MKKTLAALVASAALIVGGLGFASAANADIPSLKSGNITALPQPPRIINTPGQQLAANQLVTIQVAGKRFGLVDVPANATGVTLNLTVSAPAAAGTLRVWTTGAGEPGTGALYFNRSQNVTNLTFVALDSEGRFNVRSTAAARLAISMTSYVTPAAAAGTGPVGPQGPKGDKGDKGDAGESAPEPVVKTMESMARKTIDVGGSIRSRSTDFGSVTLAAGTWDTRVILSYQGLNASNNTVPADVFLTASAVLVDDSNEGTPEDPFDFSDVKTTVGGVIIPDAQSATLTQDPTVAMSTFITLTEETTLHVRGFAYASDSSQAGSGELKAGLDSAVFVKIK